MDNQQQQENHDERRARAWTDADIEALAAKIVERSEEAIIARFYRNLGMGVWGLLWKAAVAGMLALAAYGAVSGKKL